MKLSWVSVSLLIAIGLLSSASAAAQALPTLTGNFVYPPGSNNEYSYTMVGNGQPSTGSTTNIPVNLVPLTITFPPSVDGCPTTYDPHTQQSNLKSALQNVLNSPIFDASTLHNVGTVEIGPTQYIDAFQQASFWQQIPTGESWHLYLGQPTGTVNVLTYPYAIDLPLRGPLGTDYGGSSQINTAYGGCIGSMDDGFWTFYPDFNQVNYLETTILPYFI